MGGSHVHNGSWRKAALAVLLLLALFGAMLAVESSRTEGAPGDKLYWVAEGKIQRSDLDGSNVEVIYTGAGGDVHVDPYASKLYWNEDTRIRRADLDGTNVEDFVSGLPNPGSIAQDFVKGVLYWVQSVDFGDAQVMRASLDGTGVEEVDAAPADTLFSAIAIDSSRRNLFILEVITVAIAVAKYSIVQSDLDRAGQSTITSISSKWENLTDIALNHVSGLVYYTRVENETHVPFLCTSGAVVGGGGSLAAENPKSVAIDASGGKVYWTDNRLICFLPDPETRARVRRANLDGTDIEDIATGLASVGGIAIALADPPPMPVGGIAGGTGLVPLPAAEERGASATPRVAAAALIGIGAALSAAWFARRKSAAR